jgi:hypothetical protein
MKNVVFNKGYLITEELITCVIKSELTCLTWAKSIRVFHYIVDDGTSLEGKSKRWKYNDSEHCNQ